MDRTAPTVDDVHMPGQDGRTSGQVGTAWVAAVSVLLAAVLLSAVGVAALRSDTASADTRLERGADAVVVLPDGTRRAGVQGETLPPGTTVLAGRSGAVLETREREVWLGADTSVTVLDGARQELERGFVMVNADDAPGLSVRTAAATVSADDDSLVRIDVGPLTRVGVLRGAAAQVRPTDRRATTVVPTYFQVQLRTGGLPGAASPFVLTPDDDYEMELAADLVRADADLTALARRLDADDAAGRLVQTALRRDVPADAVADGLLVPGAPLSERTLGYLMAAAAPADAPVGVRYASVRALRTDGGSWGVVAAIVRAPVQGVAAALDALIEPTTVPVLAAQPLDRTDLLDLVDGRSPVQDPGAGTEPSRPADPNRPQPSRSPRPVPSPTPAPTPGPADPVTGVVDEVVDTVLDIVGSPTPVPVAPAPTPSSTTEPLVDLELDLPPLLD